MKKFLTFLCAMTLVLGFVCFLNPSLSNATGIYIDFEETLDGDGTQFDTWDRITDQYSSMGVTFSTTNGLGFAIFDDVYPNYYIPHSPTRIAGTNAQSGNRISFDQSWGTVGGWLNVASPTGNSQAYMQVGYWDNNNNLLDTDDVYRNYGTETTNFESSVGGIDYITFSHSENINDYWWAVDDVYAAPVPEPSTILLMGIGLLGLVGYSRKRSKKS